jgi:hypothetical protein
LDTIDRHHGRPQPLSHSGCACEIPPTLLALADEVIE